ncbi:hypothetical protein [Salipiger sp.]|uniref:hypothetical protein n=1 Tax=Salipiger sp. TaxID=2078585 RepID=UPI003A9869FA
MNVEPFDLDKFQLQDLSCAFRKRKDIISFWMHVVKTVVSYTEPAKEQVSGKMLICTDKMHRVFIHSDTKSFSTSLPFSIKKVDDYFSCTLKTGIEIDSKISSEVIAALSTTASFENGEVLGFADDVMGVSDDPDTLWTVLSELINADDGYIRFDHDPDNENGALHPLNHLDIFFSQSATFKVGLHDRLHVDAFSDILNTKTNCHFLMKD